MRARARFVGLLMVIVLLVAVVAAITGPEVYIVTLDDFGNSYYLERTEGGILGPQTKIIQPLDSPSTYGVGIGYFTDDNVNGDYYDFVAGSGTTEYPPKVIYLYEKTNPGNSFDKIQIGEWASGQWPADMPVANFDGKVFDGNALDDFVMVRYDSPDVGVYLNNGDGTFNRKEPELAGAASTTSFGADVADINHDGFADVVVAQNSRDPLYDPPYYIYVNLGNGDGSFTTSKFPTFYNTPYFGITAADFDGDNKVDLIATIGDNRYSATGFDFYKGDGTANGFTWIARFGEIENIISISSPVDNYDLDGSGTQDLIISNLQSSQYDVVVARNDGVDEFGIPIFTFLDPILGDATGARMALSAPPVFQNEAPVADFSISPALPETGRIAKDTLLKFDGSSSYDPEFKGAEDQYMEYRWEFKDEGSKEPTIITGKTAEYTFATPGTSFVTLTVTDNYGATSKKEVEVKVNHPPEANDRGYDAAYKTPLVVGNDFGVLAGIVDPDGDDLTAVLVSEPANGMLTLNADGSFTYDPYDEFTGQADSFTYKVNDGWNDSDVATVTFNFNAPLAWNVNIFPSIIYPKSKGLIFAIVTLPKEYNAADVQDTTVYCQAAQATRLIRYAKHPHSFMAIFKISDFGELTAGTQKFTVSGKVSSKDGGPAIDFSGEDTVRVLATKNCHHK